jgi:acyl carrier protein
MEKKDILLQLHSIFSDVLDSEDIILTEVTSANDVEGWDSLSHIQLIVAIEKYFKIKFTSKEIISWKNIGEMIDGIIKRLGNA